MEKKFYLYYQSILKFLHSINIKFDPFIDRVNDYYLNKMDIDTDDPTTYPYYINLMGEYHTNDTSIYITDFTSKAQVELNHINIDDNVNRIIYLKDFSLYKSLLEKYPEQKHLIRCIFFPIKYTQSEAIDADNFTLLGYDDKLLDEKERDNIIFDIKEFLEYFKFRWYIKTFNYEELHPMMVWAILWNVLPLFLLTKKIYYIKTGNVDNFHLWEYLLSKGLKDYTGYLTSHQNTYLYRNVEYLNKNIGKKLIIDSLDETLLEPIGLKLHNKWVLHDLTDGIENAHWNPISINRPTDDNNEILRTENFQNLLDTIEENKLDRNRYLEYKDDIQKSFTFTKHNHLITKYQEIITTFKDFKYFQYYIQFVSDTIFNLIKHDRVDIVINLTNDIDMNEMISINQSDAIYILYYIYYIKNNKVPIDLPKLYTSLIGINTFESPTIDDEFIYDGETRLISDYLDVTSILDSITYLNPLDIFTDKDLLSTYIDKRFDLWIQLTINKRNSHERFQKYAVSNLINQLCIQETFEFNDDDMTYVDYFTSKPQIKSFLDKYIPYRDYYDDLIYRIFEGFITIHEDIRNFIIFDVKKNTQFNKMKQLFVQFNSYLIKLLDNDLIQQNYISLPSPVVSFRYVIEPTVGVFAGGSSGYSIYLDTIECIDISTSGNVTYFGDLSVGKRQLAATSNGTNSRGVFAGGYNGNYVDVIEWINMLVDTGSVTYFGDLSVGKSSPVATSNGTSSRGVFAGGVDGSNILDTIEYINISADTGSITYFGDLSVGKTSFAATSNGTLNRGVFAGGRISGSSRIDVIEYINISADTGFVTYFGDLSLVRNGLTATSNGTNSRGVFAGGYHSGSSVNVIEYINMSADTGSVSDFGDLSVNKAELAATSNGTNSRGVFAGGYSGGGSGTYYDTIEYINISAATGSVTNFGDLSVAKRQLAATSDA